MNRFSPAIAFTTILTALLPGAGQVFSQSSLPAITVTGQTPGLTPFVARVQLHTNNAGDLRSVAFKVTPKAGSVTRPVSAVYYADYLAARGYLDVAGGQVGVPVFGLYANYANTVTVTARFANGLTRQQTVVVTTPAFNDPYSLGSPTVVQPRTNSTALSYDYVVLKNLGGTQSPTVIDTDGAVRWIGETGEAYFSSIFFDNSFYIAHSPPGGGVQTGFDRLELDGTYTFLADYRNIGVTLTSHHNADPGKRGVLLPVDTTVDKESVVLEVDTTGNVLKSWNLAEIISAAMRAGGDDPAQFVPRNGDDWFHNNANTYRRSDDTIILSSRENFVIAIDYTTGAIKWILGDSAKKWYQFASLRKYALALTPGSLPPIGQHAVSITHDDHLLLFDNGTDSAYQMPKGNLRTYSTPRKYRIDTQAMTATETLSDPASGSIYSAFISSVYEDDPANYLIDYANVYMNNVWIYSDLLGLDASGARIFEYRYPTTTFAWNAIPIHFENLVFTGPVTSLVAGHPKFFTGEVPLSNGVYYLDFPETGNPFGYYSYLDDPHYIYHFGLGYEYRFDVEDSQRGSYFYDFASQSFFYTSPTFPFPYLYDFSLGTVLYYLSDPKQADTAGPRYFYNFATGQVITK